MIGALQLLNKEGGFAQEDVNLVVLMAHFASSVIERERSRHDADSARLLRHELDLARDVQARLLPQDVASVIGMTAITVCRPARTIGGDYCDLIPLGEGRLAFTLGDVSGKGIDAAVMMASIQTLLRSLLQQQQSSLVQVVCDLNRALYASSTANRYSTLLCGVVDAPKQELTFVNAGHVSPLLLRADGRLIVLSGGGTPVGLFPSCVYQQETVNLQTGDSIVVVSDGITEACNAGGEFWDESRVGEIVQRHGCSPIEDLPPVLCAEVDAWAAGVEQFDDMTIVAIHIT